MFRDDLDKFQPAVGPVYLESAGESTMDEKFHEPEPALLASEPLLAVEEEKHSKAKYSFVYKQNQIINVARASGIDFEEKGVCHAIATVFIGEFFSGEKGLQEFKAITTYLGHLGRNSNLLHEIQKNPNFIFNKIKKARGHYKEIVANISPLVAEFIELQMGRIDEERLHLIQDTLAQKLGMDAFDELKTQIEDFKIKFAALPEINKPFYRSAREKILAGQAVSASHVLLSEEERVLLQLSPFFESVEISQIGVEQYPELTSLSSSIARMWSFIFNLHSIDKNISLLLPYQAENRGGIVGFGRLMIKEFPSDDEFSELLQTLAAHHQECSEGFSIFLTANDHAIAVAYRPSQGWVLCNPNWLPYQEIPLSDISNLAGIIRGGFAMDGRVTDTCVKLAIYGLKINEIQHKQAILNFLNTDIAKSVFGSTFIDAIQSEARREFILKGYLEFISPQQVKVLELLNPVMKENEESKEIHITTEQEAIQIKTILTSQYVCELFDKNELVGNDLQIMAHPQESIEMSVMKFLSVDSIENAILFLNGIQDELQGETKENINNAIVTLKQFQLEICQNKYSHENPEHLLLHYLYEMKQLFLQIYDFQNTYDGYCFSFFRTNDIASKIKDFMSESDMDSANRCLLWVSSCCRIP